MTANTPEEIAALKKIGKIVALTIKEMKDSVKPGMTTKELDDIGANTLRKYGATSAPQKMYQFPGATCISLNHEVAHGIPSQRVIKAGDLINIDVSAELDGYYGDAGHSFQIAPVRSDLARLCRYTEQTMMKVISNITHGTKLNEIGRIIEREARKGGYKVIKNLCSHGIGRSLHEEPQQILHVYNPDEKYVLHEGQVITIEPFLSSSADYVVEQADGWTLSVQDASFVAQHEHTIIVTKGAPIITTVA